MEIIKDIFGNKKEVVAVYKGTKIVLNIDKETATVCDKDFNKLEGDFYYISTESYVKQKLGFKDISIQDGKYIHRTPESIAKGIEFIKNKIDQEIQYQIDKQKERIEIHKNSTITTFVCNNVTINVLQYGNDVEIYLNEQPLRHSYLPENFTFNDILKNIHTRTIAKYNVCKFSNLKTNFYKNRKTIKIDIDIFPLYEFLGMTIEIKGKEYNLIDVRENGFNEVFIVVENNEWIKVSMDDLKDIKVLESGCSIKTFTGLQNKLKFYE